MMVKIEEPVYKKRLFTLPHYGTIIDLDALRCVSPLIGLEGTQVFNLRLADLHDVLIFDAATEYQQQAYKELVDAWRNYVEH